MSLAIFLRFFPTELRVSRSSVVRAPNWYLGGHGLDSRWGVIFFLYPTLVTKEHIIIWTRVFYWELNHSKIPYATPSGTRVAYFPYDTLASVISLTDVTIRAISTLLNERLLCRSGLL